MIWLFPTAMRFMPGILNTRELPASTRILTGDFLVSVNRLLKFESLLKLESLLKDCTLLLTRALLLTKA